MIISGPSDIPRPEGLHWRYGPPPTAAQVAAHDGPWERVTATGRYVTDLARKPLSYRDSWRRPVVYRDGESWPSLNVEARPWPTIIGATRWDFSDGSWCDPHPEAEGMEWVPVEEDDPDDPLSGWHDGPAHVYLDGQWNSGRGHSGLTTGATIAERVRAAFDALQAASSDGRPSTVRVDLTPAQMRRLTACGWDGGDGALSEWLVSRAEVAALRDQQADPRLRRYAFLVGYAGRSDEEEAEVHQLAAELQAEGSDPGWDITPRANTGVVREDDPWPAVTFSNEQMETLRDYGYEPWMDLCNWLVAKVAQWDSYRKSVDGHKDARLAWRRWAKKLVDVPESASDSDLRDAMDDRLRDVESLRQRNSTLHDLLDVAEAVAAAGAWRSYATPPADGQQVAVVREDLSSGLQVTLTAWDSFRPPRGFAWAPLPKPPKTYERTRLEEVRAEKAKLRAQLRELSDEEAELEDAIDD